MNVDTLKQKKTQDASGELNEGVKGITVFSRTSENLLSKEVIEALDGLRNIWYPTKEGEEVVSTNLVIARLSRFLLPVGHPAGYNHAIADEIAEMAKGLSSNAFKIREWITTLFNNREQLQRMLNLANIKSLRLAEDSKAEYHPQLYPDIDEIFPEDYTGKEKSIEDWITEIQKKVLSPEDTKKKLSQIKIPKKAQDGAVGIDPGIMQRKKLLERQRKASIHVPVDVNSEKRDIYRFALESSAFEITRDAVRTILKGIEDVMDEMVKKGGNTDELKRQRYYLKTYIIDKLMPAESMTLQDAKQAELTRLRNVLWLFDTFGLGNGELKEGQGISRSEIRFAFHITIGDRFKQIVEKHLRAFFDVDTTNPEHKSGVRNMPQSLVEDLKKLEAYPDEALYKRAKDAGVRTVPGGLQGKIRGGIKTLSKAYEEHDKGELERVREYFEGEYKRLGDDLFWQEFTGKYLSRGLAERFNLAEPELSLIKYIQTKQVSKEKEGVRDEALLTVYEYNDVFAEMRNVVHKKWKSAEHFTAESRNKKANTPYEKQEKILEDYIKSAQDVQKLVKEKRNALQEQINDLEDKDSFIAKVYGVILRAYDEFLDENNKDVYAFAIWNENIERAKRALDTVKKRAEHDKQKREENQARQEEIERQKAQSEQNASGQMKERAEQVPKPSQFARHIEKILKANPEKQEALLTKGLIQKLEYVTRRALDTREALLNGEKSLTNSGRELKDEEGVWQQTEVLLALISVVYGNEDGDKGFEEGNLPEKIRRLYEPLKFLYDAHKAGTLYQIYDENINTAFADGLNRIRGIDVIDVYIKHKEKRKQQKTQQVQNTNGAKRSPKLPKKSGNGPKAPKGGKPGKPNKPKKVGKPLKAPQIGGNGNK